ncbi:protein TIC 20-II, chloroplastic [Haematococcus lacustris]|uniref:Protein TIC 20-II, chloroplastic n=1 Tax=Haematococcus lacustris TaxID=44745 RepID=A0A699ZBA6_HAELA|nr:protein TIC 20-II, chloroplastic [Haematococcus lacustris]
MMRPDFTAAISPALGLPVQAMLLDVLLVMPRLVESVITVPSSGWGVQLYANFQSFIWIFTTAWVIFGIANSLLGQPSLSVPVSVDLTTPAGAALAEALPVAFLWVAQAGALWVSQLMLQLWPYIARAVEEAVKAKVPKLKTFSMGSHPPIVRSVHVQPVSAENLNKVRLVVGVEWSSSLDVQLEIKPLPAKLP